MTLQERVKSLPAEERLKFFRAMVEVSDAGRKAGVSPEDWARMYADTYKAIGQHLDESTP
jgi:hypothetical protein